MQFSSHQKETSVFHALTWIWLCYGMRPAVRLHLGLWDVILWRWWLMPLSKPPVFILLHILWLITMHYVFSRVFVAS